MERLTQTLFIRVFDPVYGVTGKLTTNKRNSIVQILCFFFPVYMILFYSKTKLGLQWTHFETHIVGSIVILLIAVFSIDRKLTYVGWNKLIYIPLFLCGIGLIITGIMHPIGDGYRFFGFMLILVYPALFFVWNNRGDYHTLYERMAIAMLITGIVWFIFCFVMAFSGDLEMPGERMRVKGIMDNANLLSFSGMPIVCGALYLFITKNTSWRWTVCSSFGLGSGLALVWLGQSRAAIMVCAVNLIIAVLFFVRYRCNRESAGRLLFKTMVVLVVALTVFLLGMTLPMIQTATTKDVANIENTGEAQGTIDSTVDRFKMEGDKDLNTFTSGRVVLWKNYAKQINLTGNDFDNTDWEKLTNYSVGHAHNNFLEIGYRSGILVAIMFLLLEIIAGVFIMGYIVFDNSRRLYVLMPILFGVMYAVMSLFDIATIPFERDAPCYYYFALIPIIASKKHAR